MFKAFREFMEQHKQLSTSSSENETGHHNTNTASISTPPVTSSSSEFVHKETTPMHVPLIDSEGAGLSGCGFLQTGRKGNPQKKKFRASLLCIGCHDAYSVSYPLFFS